MYINSQTLKIYTSHSDVRADFPLTSFPSVLTNEMLEEVGVYSVKLNVPEYNPLTHTVREIAPAMSVEGIYEQQWEIVELEPEQIAANQEKKQRDEAAAIQNKIESLWSAADKYTSSFISGVAVGILTIGVMQQKPKALAVTSWSSAIWGEYYTRKSLITLTSQDNHDFSSFGPMPYSVPELQEEVGL